MRRPSPAGLGNPPERDSGPAARCRGTKDILGLRRPSRRQPVGAGPGGLGRGRLCRLSGKAPALPIIAPSRVLSLKKKPNTHTTKKTLHKPNRHPQLSRPPTPQFTGVPPLLPSHPSPQEPPITHLKTQRGALNNPRPPRLPEPPLSPVQPPGSQKCPRIFAARPPPPDIQVTRVPISPISPSKRIKMLPRSS